MHAAFVTLLTTAHRAKFSYTNYAGKFTVASGECSPGGRRHDTFTTHKATGKNKYKLPMNMNFTKPKAAKMGPARVASAASIEEGNCDDYDDTNNTTNNKNNNNNTNISSAFPGERSSVLHALGQRWRALLCASTMSSSGAAKRRRSSLKPFLSNAGDAQSPTAAAVAQCSARVSVQEHPRTHNSNGTSSRSSASAQGFTALVPLSPVAAAPASAAAAVALAPVVLDPSNTLHNVMVEGHITSRDLETHLAPLLARLFIEEQRKLRAARSGGATVATAAKPEPADCYSSKNTVIVVSGPPGFSDQVDALLKSLAVPTHMVLFLD
jgi:hypothetical protein